MNSGRGRRPWGGGGGCVGLHNEMDE